MRLTTPSAVLIGLICCLAMVDASAEEQIQQAVEARGPGTGDTKRLAPATRGTDLRKRKGALPIDRSRPGGKLTTRQKRLFVLGLYAAEKN